MFMQIHAHVQRHTLTSMASLRLSMHLKQSVSKCALCNDAIILGNINIVLENLMEMTLLTPKYIHVSVVTTPFVYAANKQEHSKQIHEK